MSAPRIPNVLHDRHHWSRDGFVHPCGTPYERGVTQYPHLSGINDSTGEYVSSPSPNCPDCIAANERHAALCAAAA